MKPIRRQLFRVIAHWNFPSSYRAVRVILTKIFIHAYAAPTPAASRIITSSKQDFAVHVSAARHGKSISPPHIHPSADGRQSLFIFYVTWISQPAFDCLLDVRVFFFFFYSLVFFPFFRTPVIDWKIVMRRDMNIFGIRMNSNDSPIDCLRRNFFSRMKFIRSNCESDRWRFIIDWKFFSIRKNWNDLFFKSKIFDSKSVSQ